MFLNINLTEEEAVKLYTMLYCTVSGDTFCPDFMAQLNKAGVRQSAVERDKWRVLVHKNCVKNGIMHNEVNSIHGNIVWKTDSGNLNYQQMADKEKEVPSS